jgi:hypothetical protein
MNIKITVLKNGEEHSITMGVVPAALMGPFTLAPQLSGTVQEPEILLGFIEHMRKSPSYYFKKGDVITISLS